MYIAPSQAPRNLRVSEVTSSSVSLEWKGLSSCLDVNGAPSGWQVTMAPCHMTCHYSTSILKPNISGVYRLFPRCLETPLAHKRGGARHILRLYTEVVLNQTVFPGSSACTIMEKRSGTRE